MEANYLENPHINYNMITSELIDEFEGTYRPKLDSNLTHYDTCLSKLDLDTTQWIDAIEQKYSEVMEKLTQQKQEMVDKVTQKCNQNRTQIMQNLDNMRIKYQDFDR